MWGMQVCCDKAAALSIFLKVLLTPLYFCQLHSPVVRDVMIAQHVMIMHAQACLAMLLSIPISQSTINQNKWW